MENNKEEKKIRTTPVKCRYCHGTIDRVTGIEGIDWVMRSRNWYYHKKCFDTWKAEVADAKHANLTEEQWFDQAWEYLTKYIKLDLNYGKTRSQWASFISKRKYPAKGMYFALLYFYDVLNGDPMQSKGGIGIIPHIYDDSRAYWYQREEKERGIVEKLTKQLQEKEAWEQTRKIIRTEPKKENRRKLLSLDDI
jgi:hypothetical protein